MKVRSVFEFAKTPSPDVYGHYPPLHPEHLHTKKPGIQRSVVRKYAFGSFSTKNNKTEFDVSSQAPLLRR